MNKYIVTALVTALTISLGVNGTLLLRDRTEFGSALNKIASTQEIQANILHKLCMMAPLDHKGRVEHLKIYPFIWPYGGTVK